MADLLKREGDQVFEGLREVTRVETNKVVFRTNSAVNNIPLRRIVTVKSPVVAVTGIKTFTELNLQQMAVNLLNNVSLLLMHCPLKLVPFA